MRHYMLAVALVVAPVVASCSIAAPAWAENERQTPEARELAAARTATIVIFDETGSLRLAVEQSITLLLPQVRQQVTASANYQTMSQAHQEAVLAFIDTGIMRVMQDEVTASMPTMIDTAAPRLTPIFNEEELLGLATLLRHPLVRDQFLYGVTQGVHNAIGQTPPPPRTFTAEEMASAGVLSQTPAGIAFAAHAEELSAILAEAIRSALNADKIRRVVAEGMCEAAGEECPPALRNAATGG